MSVALHRDCRIDLVPNPERIGLEWVQFERGPTEAVLVATDGFVIVSLRVEASVNDVPGPIPAQAMAYGRSITTARDPMMTLWLDDPTVVGVTGPKALRGAWFDRPIAVESFPKWREIVPKPKAKKSKGKPQGSTPEAIGLNPMLLSKVGRALGGFPLKMAIGPTALDLVQLSPVYHWDYNPNASQHNTVAFAAIMPVRVSK